MNGISRSFFIAVLLSGAAFTQSQSDQSLGDLARANRANKQAQETSASAPKVITNQDLPAGSTQVPQSAEADPMTTVSGVKKSDRYADQQLSNRLHNEQRVSAEWKARIQEQENRIADLQARIDHVNAAIHSAVGTAQYDTPANRYQAVQTERLANMQETLDQQKRRLAQMQDAARHAGMDQ
jgi:chromosome segregation ATPase